MKVVYRTRFTDTLDAEHVPVDGMEYDAAMDVLKKGEKMMDMGMTTDQFDALHVVRRR